MNCTKNLDTSIALACNHSELHILYPPSCQDKTKLPSSVNTWDGLSLTTQHLGCCWCACCCGLLIDVPIEGGNYLPLRGLRSFSSIERQRTLAGGAKKLACSPTEFLPPPSKRAYWQWQRSLFHGHDIVRELPCVKSIQNMRSILLRTTKFLAVYRLGSADSWKQLHTKKTSRRQIPWVPYVYTQQLKVLKHLI